MENNGLNKEGLSEKDSLSYCIDCFYSNLPLDEWSEADLWCRKYNKWVYEDDFCSDYRDK